MPETAPDDQLIAESCGRAVLQVFSEAARAEGEMIPVSRLVSRIARKGHRAAGVNYGVEQGWFEVEARALKLTKAGYAELPPVI